MASSNLRMQPARGTKRRYHTELTAQINMLPMIDVMLVLLIMFMVATPLAHHAIKIKLPSGKSSAAPPDPKAINVAVQIDGTVILNRKPVALEDFIPALQALAPASQDISLQTVNLYADTAVPYGRVVQTMSAISTAGLVKLRFVSKPSSQ